eukprot:sb/3467842/
MSNLKSLDMSGNQVTGLSRAVIQPVILWSVVVEIGRKFSEQLPKLQVLEMSSNLLGSSEVEILKLLPVLTRLRLSNNKISGISANLSTFASIFLVEVDFRPPRPRHLPPSISLILFFSHLLGLRDLDIYLYSGKELSLPLSFSPSSSLLLPSSFSLSSSLPLPLRVSISPLSHLSSPTQGLRDLDIYLYSGKAQHIVQYLRQCLMNSKPYYRLKLFVVGLEGRGKTSLVGSIIKKSDRNPSNLATVGVEKHDWFYKGKKHVVNIERYPWYGMKKEDKITLLE